MKRGRFEVLTIVIVLLLVLVGFGLFDVINEKLSKKEISSNVISDNNLDVTDKYVPISNTHQAEGAIKREFKGYIIEFKEDPVLVKEEKLKNESGISNEGQILQKIKRELDEYKEIISNSQDNFIRKIKEKDFVLAPNAPFKRHLKIRNKYKNVFNGISIDASQELIDEIKKDLNIKRIVPNYKVNITLINSIPFLEADKVWLRDSVGGLCATSGKDCLTGKGVRIGIIDTGVDYSHPDLGNSVLNERVFQKISQIPIFSFFLDGWEIDQQIRFDGNKLAYSSGNQIFIYNFETGNSEIINLPTSNLKVIRLVLSGNLIAYFAVDEFSYDAHLYLYNIETRVHKKILTMLSNHSPKFGYLDISNNKIIYSKNEYDGVLREGISNIYVYDIVTELTTTIAPDSSFTYLPIVSNNLIAYSVSSSSWCYEKIVIYNMDTGESRDIIPPTPGPVLDFEGSKIFYAECYDYFNKYYLYDINTGEYTLISSSDSSSPAISGGLSNVLSSFSVDSWIQKGAIGSSTIFFSKNVYESSKIYAYDLNTQSYNLINLYKPIGGLDAYGDKLCFISNDFNIYCHDYSTTNDYSIPPVQFNAKVIGGWDFFSNDNDPFDEQGHGTHVAATAAGNGILKGVAPDAKIYTYRVLGPDGSGYEDDIIAAIERSIDPNQDGDYSDHLEVISLSLGADCWGYYDEFCGPDDPMSIAIDNAISTGVTAVVAAGNSGPDPQTIISPGTSRKAITVGALCIPPQIGNDPWCSNDIALFSSRGPVVWMNLNGQEQTLDKPDILSPGVSICAAEYDNVWSDIKCLDDKHIAISGTSMATPHVSGIVALMKQKNPAWTPSQIKSYIKSKATDLGYDPNEQGSGKINAIDSVFLKPRCHDKLDNDNDNAIDYPNDFSCS
ncbi:MAG: S8 family serine peptidase, partial [Nanoarchaeota archaeon]